MAKEKRIAVCRQSLVAYIPHIVLAALLVIGGIGTFFGGTADASTLLGMFIIAALILLYVFISLKTYKIELTETKVIGHKGFIKSVTLSAPLSKVQDIGIGNGLFGKIFGYHTVTINTAGSGNTEFVFRRMAKAQSFVDAVEEQTEKVK